MRNGKHGRYTREFKQEAVRLVEPGQCTAAAARSLGVVEQTPFELDHGASRRPVDGGSRQGRGDRRADGDQSVARRVAAGQDGARHPEKSHGIRCVILKTRSVVWL